MSSLSTRHSRAAAPSSRLPHSRFLLQPFTRFGGLAAIILAFLAFDPQTATAQLFTQNFSSSATVSDYVSAASPTTSQFNAISTSGAGFVWSITGGKLRATWTAAQIGAATRTTDFSGPPSSLIVKLDFSRPTGTTATTSALFFQIGGTLTTGNNADANTTVHSRFAVNSMATAGDFALRRNESTPTNSSTLSGTQSLMWVINNSGGSLTYKAPDGTYETVANDTWDLWAGTTKIHNDIAALTASQTLARFKILSGTATTSTFDFDNIVIDPIPSAPSAAPTFSSVGSSGFTVGWNAATGATGYRLDIATDSGFTSLVSGYNNLAVAGTSQAVTGLNGSTTYYARVRTENNAGTSNHSSTGTQATSAAATAPTVTTNTTVTSISTTGATLGGNITNINGANATVRGFEYSPSSGFGNGTGTNSTDSGDYGNGTFTKAVSSLTANTLYYFKAKAQNSAGTGWGAEASFTTLPLPPSVGTGSGATSSGFTANWSLPTMGSATHNFTVEVSTNNSTFASPTTVTGILSGNTSQAITGLSPSTTYYYRIKSVNAQGDSTWSSGSAGIATTTASTPTISAAASFPALSTFAGTASASSNIAVSGAALTAGITATRPSSDFEVSSDNSTWGVTATFAQSSGSASGTLYVRLSSTAAVGTPSGNVALTSTGATTVNASASGTVYKVAPSAHVTSFATGSITTSSIPLTWTAATGSPDGYLIRVSSTTVTDPVNGTAIADDTSAADGVAAFNVTSGATTSDSSFTGFVAGTTYTFKIYPYNNSGSNIRYYTAATVPSVTGILLPAAPAAPTFSGVTSTGLTVNWIAVAGATNYQLDLATDSGFSSLVANYGNLTTGNVTTQAVTGLSANVTYHARLRAVNSTGTSTSSTSASQITSELSAPTSSAATSVTASSFNANWSAVTGATGYQLDVYSGSSSTSTIYSANFNAFTGTGFASSPTAGQLDSDDWKITGMSDGNPVFGASSTTGDFALGASAGGVTAGGVYAFTVGAGNVAFGVQPTTNDWTPGTIVLRVQNTTGSTLTSVDVSYKIWVRNDQAVSTSFNFSHSADDNTYTSVADLNYTSTATADGSPAWVSVDRSTTITGLNIANNGYYYLRWSSDDVSGSGSRDEFALDDVSVTSTVSTLTYLLQNQSTGNATTYAVSGASPSTAYSYVVRATSSNSTSVNSNVTTLTTNASATPPVVTGATLNGTVGTAFAGHTISATNSPTGYALESGTLPAGLSLNATTGAITGTPTAAGNSSLTINATNAFGSGNATFNFAIARGNQTITFPAQSSLGIGSTRALDATTTSNLTISYTSSNTSVATINGGNVTGVALGNTTLTASQAGDANWNAATSETQNLQVTVLPIYQHSFGTTAISSHPYTVAPETLNSNLSSSSWSTSGSSFTSFAGSSGQAIALSSISGTPTITLTFNVASGYALEINSLSFYRVRSGTGPTSAAITINGGAAVYTDTVPTVAANTGSQAVTGKTQLTGTVTVLISLSGASGGTFRLDDFTLSGVVTQLPQVATATYNGTVGTAFSQALATTGGTPTGFATTSGTLPTGLSLNATTGSITGTPSAAGNGTTVSILASNTGGNGTAATITFNIAKANSTISVTGSTSFTFTGSAQGPTTSSVSGSSGAVTYSYSGTGGTSHGPSATRPTAAGNYTATATVAADANYNTASSSAYAFTIAQATQSITFGALSSKTYGDSTFSLTATASSSLSISYASSNTSVATVAGSTVTVVGAGSTTITASQAGDSNYTAATNVTQTLTVGAKSLTGTFTANDKTYDGSTSATVATRAVTGKVGADDVTHTGGTATFANATVGNGKTVTLAGATLTGAAASNYSLGSVSTTTANITQATPTISVAPTASNITIGQTLANSTLSGGTASVAGAFAFTTPATAPALGISSQGVTFTPTDSTNYTAQTTNANVGVLCLAPTLTRATLPVAGGFTVNWSAVTGAGNYTVLHSASKNMTGATSVNTASTSLAITGLTNGLRYVQVWANNAAGASANSTQQVNQLQSIAAGATSYLSAPGNAGTNTVAGIFGAANEAGLASGATDSASTNILLLDQNGATANTIFYNSSVNQWREGATAMESTAIAQGKAFMLKNNTGSTDYFLLVGTPREGGSQPTVSLNPAGKFTLCTTGRTAPTSLADMNLNPGSGAGAFKTAAKAKDADKVIVVDQTTGAATNYYHNGTNWMDGLRAVPTAEIPAGQGFFIKKASDSTFSTWTLPAE